MRKTHGGDDDAYDWTALGGGPMPEGRFLEMQGGGIASAARAGTF